MKNKLEVRVLGTGTSQGVPMVACKCAVCHSDDSKDKRLRSSILFTWNDESFVIDTGPDFRYQMLRENIQSLRGVIYTHEHKDHIAGMDDIRAFNYAEKRDMEIYCSKDVEKALKREFYYAFLEDPYPGVPKLNLNIIRNRPFQLIDGPMVTPILGYHYKMQVFGFRVANFAYMTDVNRFPDGELEKLKGLDVLILDCLRIEPHISHLNLAGALEVIKYIQPKMTYLTHISHLFGKHQDIMEMLPQNVEPAYDGLRLSL